MRDNIFQNKQIVVTGASGFIGSHLVDRLLDEGAIVVGVDNLITGRESNLDKAKQHHHFTFINSDVSMPPETYLPQDFIPDFIFHFASPASPPKYQAFPIETYLVNSIGTHHLLQFFLKKNDRGRFIFASTSEVYGDPLVHPQTESYWGNVNPNGIRSCYDESKRLGEAICGVHSRDKGLDVRIVRIFNTYGPRINPNDGRVIPEFVGKAMQNESINIHGDGTQTRSYCYVDDLVSGILQFSECENGRGETVNVGNPTEMSVKKTADLIIQNVGSSSQFNYLPLPKDDPLRRQPDISKIKKICGWEPIVSFEDGIGKTIEYFREKELS